MIDYSELPADGILFEQLIREMFLIDGYEAHWTGVGVDEGRDLLINETLTGPISTHTRRWLVTCKHFANSKKSVGRNEVQNIVDDCKSINAEGIILACTTQPTSSLVKRFEEIEKNQGLLTKIWDGIEIEKRLCKPHTFSLIKTFLPNNDINKRWNIYNTNSPDSWSANYRGYFFYMYSRTANTFPELKDIDVIIDKFESIEMPSPANGKSWDIHVLRLREIFYDNKHDQYSIKLDYLYPHNESDKRLINLNSLLQQLENWQGLYSDGEVMWKIANWDIRYKSAIITSDHFHLDHKDYYK